MAERKGVRHRGRDRGKEEGSEAEREGVWQRGRK